MTLEEAKHKLDFMKKAYQMLIDEKVDNGKLVGDGVRGEWKAEASLDEAYKDMIEALDFAIKALESTDKIEESNFSTEQYKADLQGAFDCGYAKGLEQQPSEDTEVIKVSKGAVKARQGRFVIYDVDWLKKNFYSTEEKIYGQPKQPSEDCRNCKKWSKCPCGKEGHENGTSIGYSIGECKDYEPCEDCISILNRIMEYTYGMLTAEKYGLQHLIESMMDELPSVTPQRPKGKWIDIEIDAGEFIYKYSKCGMRAINPYKYCPNCGGHNGGGEDG